MKFILNVLTGAMTGLVIAQAAFTGQPWLALLAVSVLVTQATLERHEMKR